MFTLRSICSLPSALLVAAAAYCGGVRAQQPAPFDGKIELLELQTTLQVAHAKIQELEKQLAAAKEQNVALAQGTAAANAEVVQLKDNHERLRGLLEGLGIGALENSTDQVQERLLGALSDLRIVTDQKKKLSDSLVGLAEASMVFAKTAQNSDAEARRTLETALAKGDQVLRAANNVAAGDEGKAAKSLHEARVVSMKPEFGVAILDVGSRDGVKPGMPFEITRGEKTVGRVFVTDVRKGVSGAVVQEVVNPADPVKVGDRGKVEANRTF